MTTKEIITTTIRIPRDIWLKLRRLQEAGKIKSINQAASDAFEKLAKTDKPRQRD